MIYDNTDHLVGVELSEREKQIVKLLCLGKSRVEIAKQLIISPNTVKNHLQKVQKKTKCYSSPEIVAWAINQELNEQFNITLGDLLS